MILEEKWLFYIWSLILTVKDKKMESLEENHRTLQNQKYQTRLQRIISNGDIEQPGNKRKKQWQYKSPPVNNHPKCKQIEFSKQTQGDLVD